MVVEPEKKVEGVGEPKSGVFQWLRGFWGQRDGRAILDLPSPPRRWDTRLLFATASPVRSLRCILHMMHAKIVICGEGGVGGFKGDARGQATAALGGGGGEAVAAHQGPAGAPAPLPGGGGGMYLRSINSSPQR